MKQFPSVLKAECGAGLVEYAIVIALLLTMLLGIADFSRALYAYHFVSNAAREATRYAAVRGNTCASDGSCTAPATLADIQTFVNNVPLGIDASKLTPAPTLTWPIQATSPPTCSTAGNANAPGCTVQVQVTYAFNFIFPFVNKNTLTMSSTSQMIIAH